MSAKKLSENKERYGYKKVLAENGVPVPGLWQRLEKYSARVSIVKNGRIFSTFISLKAKSLQKAIDECQKLQAYWAKERNNFKIHEITENALKEEVFWLLGVFFNELLDLGEKAPSVYEDYSEDVENKEFLLRFVSMLKWCFLIRKIHEELPGLKDNPSMDQITSTVSQLTDEQLIHFFKIGNDCKLLEQRTKNDIDNLFKEALEHEDNETSMGFKTSSSVKLENILRLFGKLYTKDGNSETDQKKGESFLKALEHYQTNRRKSEELAFGTKSNTAFKIIQNVIYPLETQIRIVKALLRYCPKEEQQASKS